VNAAVPTRLDVDGVAAPPRSNGELVFTAPWESRAFAMAISMSESGQIAWEDFRRHLIGRIAAWEKAGDGEWSYYECWLDALEALAVERGLLPHGTLDDRAEALAQRPAGHDHRQPHDEDP
jgi:nitrile hydratase accessory protein